jgi:hypothetical protein
VQEAVVGAGESGKSVATPPVVRWTPPEVWLHSELTRRALVVRLDDGPPRRLGGEGCFLEARSDAEGPMLELGFRARRVELWLDPQEISGHRWREGWAMELEPLEEQGGDAPERDREGDDDDAPAGVTLVPGPRQLLQLGGAPIALLHTKPQPLLKRLRKPMVRARVRMRSLRWKGATATSGKSRWCCRTWRSTSSRGNRRRW